MFRYRAFRVSRTRWRGAASATPGDVNESAELENNYVGIRRGAGRAAGLAGFATRARASQVGSGSESQYDRGGFHGCKGSPTAAVAQEQNEEQGQRQTIRELAFCVSEGHQEALRGRPLRAGGHGHFAHSRSVRQARPQRLQCTGGLSAQRACAVSLAMRLRFAGGVFSQRFATSAAPGLSFLAIRLNHSMRTSADPPPRWHTRRSRR